MRPDLIFEKDQLIINRTGDKTFSYYFLGSNLFILILYVIVTEKIDFSSILIMIAILILSVLFQYFITPNFKKIVVTKHNNFIKVNNKKIKHEDLLFLSIREKENYNLIRLEGKRNNILFSNEKILIFETNNLEHALALCRQIRDFIDPNLKINQINIGNSKRGTSFGYFDIGGNRNDDIEIWNYVD